MGLNHSVAGLDTMRGVLFYAHAKLMKGAKVGLFSKDESLIYKTNYMGFWIKVYPDRVDFKSGAGRQSIPITQIASIKQSVIGFMRITIETTGGKKYKIPTLRKQAVQDAIYKARANK